MSRQPVNWLDCTVCSLPITPTQPLVYADSTGREARADDPYHLECYVSAADRSLPSNAPLRFVALEHVTEALEFYSNYLATSARSPVPSQT